LTGADLTNVDAIDATIPVIPLRNRFVAGRMRSEAPNMLTSIPAARQLAPRLPIRARRSD
jgi:hypothetical protein